MTASEEQKRVAMGNAAQHLLHGGHNRTQIRKLLRVAPKVVYQLLKEAEERQPKLCRGSCIGIVALGKAVPLCPYCAHTYLLIAKQPHDPALLHGALLAVEQMRTLAERPWSRK